MILTPIIIELLYLIIGVMIFKTVIWVLSCFLTILLYVGAIKIIRSECKKASEKALMIALSTTVFAAFLIWSKCRGLFPIPLIIYDIGLFVSILSDNIKSKILYLTIAAAIGALVILL